MTNGEAISRIKFLLDVGGSDGFTSSDREALNTAINALSEQENPKTNGDKIRQMSDEELAESLSGSVACRNTVSCFDTSCYECTLKWLKQWVKADD